MSVEITRRTSLLRMYAKLAGSTKTVFPIDTVTLPVPNALPSLSERRSCNILGRTCYSTVPIAELLFYGIDRPARAGG